MPNPGCGLCWFCGCNPPGNGWTQSPVPYCGESAPFYNICAWNCAQEQHSRMPACR